MGSMLQPLANGEALAAARAGELAGELVDHGYLSIVLDRLVTQTTGILGADQACIFVRDRRDGDHTILAAAHGVDADLVGKRATRTVEMLGRGRGTAVARLSYDGTVQGALSVRAQCDRGAFDRRQLETLRALGEFVSGAVHHAQARDELVPHVRSQVRDLVAILAERDGYTARHSEQTSELAGAVGQRLGVSRATELELELAAILHDLGKLRVPTSILKKPGPLDARERCLVERHAAWGAELLASIPGLEAVATIVRFHHERFDGSGYPDGLAGEHIPLPSRIIATCDALNAMTTSRPYRMGMSTAEALRELRAGAGTQFDPAVVSAAEAELSAAPPA